MWFSMQQGIGPAMPQLTVQSLSTRQVVDVLPPLLVARPPLPVFPPVPPPPAPPELIATHSFESSMNPWSHVNAHFPAEQLGVEFVGTGSEQ
jgi:hypothetical protein